MSALPRAAGIAVALETSTRHPQVAARLGDRTVERRLEASRAHAADLLPALDALLRELGATPRELRTVVVGTGPGSYTGLRVGAATALGLARGAGAVLVEVPSTEALVQAACAPGEEAAVLIDARAGEFYFARYRRVAAGVEALEAPCVLPLDGVRPRLAGCRRLFADADTLRAAALGELGDIEVDLDARPSAASALELGLARLAREGAPLEPRVEPLYLRAFAASSRRR